MSERKKNIIKDVTAYGVGRYIAQFVGFFIAVLMRNFLGPLQMGMWSLVKVVLSYAIYSEVGITQAVYYKIPLHNGKGERDEAENIQNVVFAFMILASVLASILILAAAIILKDKMPRELFVGFLVFPAFFLAQRVYSYHVMLLRANKKFFVLSKTYIFDSLFNVLLVLVVVGKFRLYGLYAVSVLLPVLDICYIRRNVKYKIKWKIMWDKIGEYIKFGFPVFVSGISMLMLYSVDRIMIAKMIGLVPLGYYSIAVMTRTYTAELSGSFAAVLSPYFIEDYGKTGDISKTGKAITTYTEIISCAMAIILGLTYLSFPVFVHYAMPKFYPGVPAMKLMLVCTFFVVIAMQLRNLLIMKDKQTTLMKISLFAIVLNVCVNYAAIRSGFGIAGVAGASVISAFSLFILVAASAIHHIKDVKLMPFLTYIAMLFMYFVLSIYAIENIVSLENLIYGALAKILLFLTVAIGAVYYVNKRTGVINIVLEAIRKKK